MNRSGLFPRVFSLSIASLALLLVSGCSGTSDVAAGGSSSVRVLGWDMVEEQGVNRKVATVWREDGKFLRLSTSLNDTEATAGVFKDNDLYISGTELVGNTPHARCWVVKDDNKVEALDLKEGAARSIAVSNSGAVGVAVESSRNFYIWTVSGKGVGKGGLITPTKSSGASSSQVAALCASGNDWYLAGSESVAGRSVARVWKNGQPQNQNTTALVYNGVFVEGDSVYAIGLEQLEKSNKDSRLKIWKDGQSRVLQSSPSAQATALFVKNGVAYVAGTDRKDGAYWRDGEMHELSDGLPKGIAVNHLGVHVAGASGMGNNTHAIYWKDSTRVQLSPNISMANAVVVK